MILDDLVTLKKISYVEAQVYRLFAVDEKGRDWFARMTHDTFMDCVPPPMMTTEILGYCDGRRSVLRDIYTTIEKIQTLLNKAESDG